MQPVSVQDFWHLWYDMGRRGREDLVLKWCRSHGTNNVLGISYSLDRAKASRESTMEAEEKSSEL